MARPRGQEEGGVAPPLFRGEREREKRPMRIIGTKWLSVGKVCPSLRLASEKGKKKRQRGGRCEEARESEGKKGGDAAINTPKPGGEGEMPLRCLAWLAGGKCHCLFSWRREKTFFYLGTRESTPTTLNSKKEKKRKVPYFHSGLRPIEGATAAYSPRSCC